MDDGEGYSPTASASGDLDPEAFRTAGHRVIDWIADYMAGLDGHSVRPGVTPGELLDSLARRPPLEGSPQDRILADFERDILPHVVHWNHPGFMAWFAAGGSSPGVLAEALSAALNNVGLLWKSSPALAELEQRTLEWLRELLGLPSNWFGLIHDSASTAVLHAVIAARERASRRAREAGRSLDLNRMVMYTSEQAHSSVEKTMLALGRGAEGCRKVPCDERFAMRADALQDRILADIGAGLQPIAVVATVGTTASNAVDPVPAIADIAARHSLWLHVDAAYAGAAAILPGQRRHFAGCELADSYVVNPHKWLFVPMDLSVLYTSRQEDFRSALSLVPEYLRSRQHPRAVNNMEYSVALGRRFRALKLWYILRSFGARGLAAAVQEHVRLAALLAEWVDRSESFERLAPTPFGLVCLRYSPEGLSPSEADRASERLLDSVNATGEFFLTHARLGGRYAIRVSIGNLRTTEEHVRRLWQLLRELSGREAGI